MTGTGNGSDSTARHFAAHGFVITEPLFDDEVLAAVCGEIERLWRQRASRGPIKYDFAVVRPELPRLHYESPLLAAFCRHPALCDMARALIGPDVDVSWNQAYVKAPDRGADRLTAIPWHQDGYYAETEGGGGYNCWIGITPMTVENGTVSRAEVPTDTPMLPHVWDDKLLFFRCEVDEKLAVPVVLEPGQAFVYHSRIPHKSGPNLSRAARIAYGISFASASARLKTNGQPFGDRIPLLRGGEAAFDLLAAYATDASALSHGGARIADEIKARAPEKAREVDELLDRYRTERSAALLDKVLALLPDDPEVLGDRVGARARTDQLWTELRDMGADPSAARVLLRRILELDPRDKRAAEELDRLR